MADLTPEQIAAALREQYGVAPEDAERAARRLVANQPVAHRLLDPAPVPEYIPVDRLREIYKQSDRRIAEGMRAMGLLPPLVAWPITFTIPWSALISDNRKYAAAYAKTRRPKLLLTPAYRTAKRRVAELAREAMHGAAPVAVPVALHARVWVPDRRRGHDVANFAKCVHDALEHVVVVNDEWLHDPRWTRLGVDVDHPRADILITPFTPRSLA